MKKEKNIFDTALCSVIEGSKFHVDFKKRSVRIDGEYLVNEGKYEGELGGDLCTVDEFVYAVEDNYRIYKHSVPSERSESKGRKYFRALPESRLSDADMMYGVHRDVAQAQLELFVMVQILHGFQWPEEWGWFWQSESDPDLVLLREWFE